MHKYEIEIKSLLGGQKNAEALIEKMQQTDPSFKPLGAHNQLNHYFIGNNNTALRSRIALNQIELSKQKQFESVLSIAKDISVRTRLADTKVIFVIKATVDDTTSSNGTARLEFESEMDLSLDELDQLVLSSGFQYQAKWSRERQEFQYLDLIVSVDKNAGYGYLAEFEKIIDSKDLAEEAKAHVRLIMKDLGVEELPQDRLERMFKFYNEHWEEYYGTNKTFVIE